MAYQQAPIKVQKTEEFERLRSALDRIFSSAALERFFRKLQASKVRVRDFERVLAIRGLEENDPALSGCGKSARQLYDALALSDQALMREFYLERIEQVAPLARKKFQEIYRYY